jgi:hypothetical protein
MKIGTTFAVFAAALAGVASSQELIKCPTLNTKSINNYGNENEDGYTEISNINTRSAFVNFLEMNNLHNCSEIVGSLVIADISFADFQDTLSHIKKIDGDFTVASTRFTSLNGLAVKEITGNFRVVNNVMLKGVDIDSLERMGGTFQVDYNPAVKLVNMKNLGFIGGDIAVNINRAMNAVEFPALTQLLGNHLEIGLNDYLQRVSFPKLTSVGQLYAASNMRLTELDFPELTQVAILDLDDNDKLDNLGSYPKLKKISHGVRVRGMKSIGNLKSLENIQTIGSMDAPDEDFRDIAQGVQFLDNKALSNFTDLNAAVEGIVDIQIPANLANKVVFGATAGCGESNLDILIGDVPVNASSAEALADGGIDCGTREPTPLPTKAPTTRAPTTPTPPPTTRPPTKEPTKRPTDKVKSTVAPTRFPTQSAAPALSWIASPFALFVSLIFFLRTDAL